MTPPKSHKVAVITAPAPLSQEVTGQRAPHLGAEAERLLIHSFVVTVKHGTEALKVNTPTEQSEPICRHAETAEEPGVRGANRQERDGGRSRDHAGGNPRDGVPQR